MYWCFVQGELVVFICLVLLKLGISIDLVYFYGLEKDFNLVINLR